MALESVDDVVEFVRTGYDGADVDVVLCTPDRRRPAWLSPLLVVLDVVNGFVPVEGSTTVVPSRLLAFRGHELLEFRRRRSGRGKAWEPVGAADALVGPIELGAHADVMTLTVRGERYLVAMDSHDAARSVAVRLGV